MAFSEKGRAWLQFFRIGGVTSALSGSLWGCLVSGTFQTQGWAVLAVMMVSLCVYLFGMGLNDLVDVEKDRGLRPNRPLPSGRLNEGKARMVCLLILIIGLVVMSSCLTVFQVICFSMAFVLVATYNFSSKHSKRVGPLTIGLARSFNVMGGMVLVDWDGFLLAVGMLHFLHAMAIFRVAEGEDLEGDLGWKRLGWLVLVPCWMLWFNALGALLWSLCLVWITRNSRGFQERYEVARLVGGLVGAFTLMEACFLLGSGSYLMGTVFMGLFFLGKWLQKAYPAG